jgi:hypothetical protein
LGSRGVFPVAYPAGQVVEDLAVSGFNWH